MNNAFKNIVRTLVPTVVGVLAAYWTKVSAHLSVDQFAVFMPVASTVYYAVVRLSEERYPRLSWLLGALPVQAAPVPVKTLPLAEVPLSAPVIVESVPVSEASAAPSVGASAPPTV